MAGTDVVVRNVSERIASAEMSDKLRAAVGSAQLAARIQRAALTAIQTTPELLAGSVTQASVYTALLRCAQDGLLPDGREAALVRRKSEIVYQPMVGGFRKRAAAHGFSLVAQLVYAGDDFTYELGVEPRLEHRPPPLGEDRGGAIGAYAVAKHASHGTFVEIMDRAEIEHVRKSASTDKVWSAWWGEMARKTVARRLFKQLPLGADAADASLLEADEIAFGPFADLPEVDTAPEIEPAEDVIENVVDAVEDDQGTFKIPDSAKT